MKIISSILIIFLVALIRNMNAQVVLEKVKYLSSDSTVIVYSDSLEESYYWYYNNKLGIRFRYFEDFNNPLSDISIASHDLFKWNNYKNDLFKIKFRYPSEFVIKKSITDANQSNKDSTIQLGYYFTRHAIERDYSSEPDSNDDWQYKIIKDSTYDVFTSIIDIYITKMTFDEIADYEGFGRGKPYSDDLDTLNNSSWRIFGRQWEEEAYYLDGFKWKGLRGQSFTGLYHSGGNYIFSVPITKSFLCQQLSSGNYLVISYYEGTTGELEDEVGDIINEDDYYNIVNSLELIN